MLAGVDMLAELLPLVRWVWPDSVGVVNFFYLALIECWFLLLSPCDI